MGIKANTKALESCEKNRIWCEMFADGRVDIDHTCNLEGGRSAGEKLHNGRLAQLKTVLDTGFPVQASA